MAAVKVPAGIRRIVAASAPIVYEVVTGAQLTGKVGVTRCDTRVEHRDSHRARACGEVPSSRQVDGAVVPLLAVERIVGFGVGRKQVVRVGVEHVGATP